MYLLLTPAFLPKISSVTYTCNMANCKYLFFYQKYETGYLNLKFGRLITHSKHKTQCVSTINTCFLTHNIKCNMYLQYGQLQLLIFSFKI